MHTLTCLKSGSFFHVSVSHKRDWQPFFLLGAHSRDASYSHSAF